MGFASFRGTAVNRHEKLFGDAMAVREPQRESIPEVSLAILQIRCKRNVVHKKLRFPASANLIFIDL